MSSETERIDYLRAFLLEQNRKYYVLDAPVISDQEYDQLLRELSDLEARHPEKADPNSPTQRVGSDLNEAFSQVRHTRPMLSLGNTYSREEVAEFYERVCELAGRPLDVSCELKFDGTSISLVYENGALVRAATRGDGAVGDDVTRNVKTIRSVPLKLTGDYPGQLEMRGEVLMTRQGFDELNQTRLDIGETPFANPRNAAAGSLKLQNSALAAERHLFCTLYYVLTDERQFATHSESLEAAKGWGFVVSPGQQVAHSLEEIYAYIDEWADKRRTLEYDTDGIVLKVNDLGAQRLMGLTAKSPRWAVAYKYKTEQAHSRLLEVTYQVGRTGVVTPVANMEPVPLGGTTVKRASLHNLGIIRDLDLHTGDVVVVEKGGEIIPKIVGVDVEKREPGAAPVLFPTTCPVCGHVLVRAEGEAAYYCPNYSHCPPQIVGKLIHFVERAAMDIDQLGDEKVEQLYTAGLVRNAADFYELSADDLLRLPGYQARSAQKTIEGIAASKSKPFDRVLFAIGIRYVGTTVARRLAAAFHNVDSLMSASVAELMGVEDIGASIAGAVSEFFGDAENRALVERLRGYGLRLEAEQQQRLGDALQGKSLVVSGVFADISRDDLKALIAAHGGKNTASISSKTDYVVAGENMGPAKLAKAKQLGVRIIGYDDLLKLIGK